MKKWIQFKTIFRLGILVYWSSALFIYQWLLLALIPYVIVRMALLLSEYRRYDEWKMVRYGKDDKKFTIRRLLYIMETSNALKMNNTDIRYDIDHNFYIGNISIDQYLKIRMTSDGFIYHAELFFKGKSVAKCKGLSFQRIKWELEDVPELQKAVTKFVQCIEGDFEQVRKEKEKARNKTSKVQTEQQQQARKELAKDARQTYKKDMSI